MTITLDLTPQAEQEIQEAAERQGKTVEELARQAITAAMIADLRDRPIPQSLADLKPRVPPPPGKTSLQMVVGQWPGDETDEQVNKALEELS